ncbi:MAG: ywpJ, partial [Marmoricola sp.]|nr:ywpJ [Marmoricola sp.]
LNDHFPGGDLTGEMVIESADQLGARPVTRIILRDPHRSVDEFIQLAQHLGLQGVTYFVGWSAWLDIAPEGVNKATALAQVAADLGIAAEDVLAAGDGRNDIEMLQWAARGVAMGQAVQEVHDAADATTETVHDDGAAVELRRWFPDRPGRPSSNQGLESSGPRPEGPLDAAS